MYKKKNLWQRIKFAFKALGSDAPILEVYEEAYKAGVESVINDYLVVRDKLVPLLEEWNTRNPSDNIENFICPPDMDLMVLTRFNLPSLVKNCIAKLGCIPDCQPVEITRKEYQMDRIAFRVVENSELMAMRCGQEVVKIHEFQLKEAAIKIAHQLLERGYIKSSLQALLLLG